MPGLRITPTTRQRFARLVFDDGVSIARASKVLGFSTATGYRLAKGLRPFENSKDLSKKIADQLPPVKSWDELTPLGRELLRDFGLFSEKVLCRNPTPWRVKAAELSVEKLLDTSERHYVVANEPPGVGKSTLWMLDIPAWLMAGGGTLDVTLARSLRFMLGHRASDPARDYVRRLQSILADDRAYYDVEQQRRAEVCLSQEFGRFQPDLSMGDSSKVWSKSRFIVAQPEDIRISEKEPTVMAVSRGAEFIGQRANYVAWDDLVTPSNSFKPEIVEADAVWMETQAEPRLEPPRGRIGSVFWLIGQRIGPNDLFRDRLDKTFEDDDGEVRRKYVQIVFPAHNEATCDGEHRQWDTEHDGCLLDEKRLSWREITKVRRSPVYRTVYQQEDSDPETTLVPRVWLDGGTDLYNEEVPGCWDRDRGFYDWPEVPGLVDYAAVDVAASGWWAVEHWANKAPEFPRYLVYGVRRKMMAGELLDWSHGRGAFVGVMEEMQRRSVEAGHPIRVWVVEANACQRHLMQFDHFFRWRERWDVSVIPHQTQKNKTDPKLGVQALLRGVYRDGMKRLPRRAGDLEALAYTEQKTRELTMYPGPTTDTVMADWEGEYRLQLGDVHRLVRPRHSADEGPVWDLPPYLVDQQEEIEL